MPNTYVFRFDAGNGTRWQRKSELGSDDAARIEGGLMLENQATTQTTQGMAVSVLRLEGDTLLLVGSWTWRQHHASWSDGGGIIVGP